MVFGLEITFYWSFCKGCGPGLSPNPTWFVCSLRHFKLPDPPELGIAGTALEWSRSYLSEWTFKVHRQVRVSNPDRSSGLPNQTIYTTQYQHRLGIFSDHHYKVCWNLGHQWWPTKLYWSLLYHLSSRSSLHNIRIIIPYLSKYTA